MSKRKEKPAAKQKAAGRGIKIPRKLQIFIILSVAVSLLFVGFGGYLRLFGAGSSAASGGGGSSQPVHSGSNSQNSNAGSGSDSNEQNGESGGNSGGNGQSGEPVSHSDPDPISFNELLFTSLSNGTCSVSIGDCTDSHIVIPSLSPAGDIVASIPNNSFSGLDFLISISIPDSVVSISSGAFINCSALESITVSEGNSYYHSSGNCLILTSSKCLIVGSNSSVIPVDGSVTSIWPNAFYGRTGLTSIIIPDSVISIGDDAFHGCSSLLNVTIPNSVTTIGQRAFMESGIRSVSIPGSVQTLNRAFINCTALTTVTLNEGLQTVDWCFVGCVNLTDVTIPSSVTTLGSRAFDIGSSSQLATFRFLSSMPPTAPSQYYEAVLGTHCNKVIVPSGSLSAFQSAVGFDRYASCMEESSI